MLEPGQSLLGLRGGVEPEWWLSSEDGRTYLPDDPRHVFYNDCAPEVAERAAAALVPQRKDAFLQELRAAAWQTRALDLCHLRARQRDPARGAGAHGGTLPDTVSRIDTSHSPFLSRPHEVTAIIQETLAVVVAEGCRDDLDELGRQPVVRGARRRPRRARHEVVAEVRRAIADGTGIRAAGAGHSFTPVVTTCGTVLEIDGLRGITHVDAGAPPA